VPSSRRLLAFLLVAVLLVAVALLGAFELQRRAAHNAAADGDTAVTALAAMLDQETGLRGYLYTGEEEFLEPYVSGEAAYEQVVPLITRAAAGDATSVQLAAGEDKNARTWEAYAAAAIAARRASATPPGDATTREFYGKQQMDAFRTSNSALRTRLGQQRDSYLRKTGIAFTAVVVALASMFALIGYAVLRAASRRTIGRGERELAYRGYQSEFSDLVQAVDTEAEAHELVQRHLVRTMPGSSVTVLSRNNSDNRLAAATSLAADSPLALRLASAEPRACLAIRLGRTHHDGVDHNELLSCGLCSSVNGNAICQPLLVGGKVIGAVLIERPEALGETERRGLIDTVAQAAPVLANLKTIAIAESRASTDALTGLPNRRSMNDTIKRMAAHAGRTAQPLAAIAFDLDRFKTINDRYGHETGDAALSAIGECLRENLRESDFAARIGGEEFLVLAPDTGLDGARILAEKLREAVEREEVPQVNERITASFGVAVMPDHAAGFEALLRRADRACYVAKDRGRNRVEVAGIDELVALPIVDRAEARL
jgi:diguanylate cyclase (GGDEF)-like protein